MYKRQPKKWDSRFQQTVDFKRIVKGVVIEDNTDTGIDDSGSGSGTDNSGSGGSSSSGSDSGGSSSDGGGYYE